MILSSKEERFLSRVGKRVKGGKFASVNVNGKSEVLRFSYPIAYEANLGERVNLIYDTEKRELLIEKDSNGTVKTFGDGVTGNGKVRNTIASFTFWSELFDINAPQGRYVAEVDDKNNIHVYFNKEFRG